MIIGKRETLIYLVLFIGLTQACKKENTTDSSFVTGQTDGDKITHNVIKTEKSIDLKDFYVDTLTSDTLKLDLIYGKEIPEFQFIISREFFQGEGTPTQYISIITSDEIELQWKESEQALINENYNIVKTCASGYLISPNAEWVYRRDYFLTMIDANSSYHPRFEYPYLIFRYKKQYIGWLRFSMEFPYAYFKLTGFSIDEYAIKEII